MRGPSLPCEIELRGTFAIEQENRAVTKKARTKKEIVKQIADGIGETQLKTKEIVQKTFDAIIDTLIEQRRIELRNFGVFEVKIRKARKARNPRTGEKVDVPPKCVVTFKPGKEMEERVRTLIHKMEHELARAESARENGSDGVPRPARVRKVASKAPEPVTQPQ
jgi:integration host factor subunit beta